MVRRQKIVKGKKQKIYPLMLFSYQQSDWDEDTVRERTRQAISEVDMTKTSMRDLRKTVEKEMGLQKNALKPNKVT